MKRYIDEGIHARGREEEVVETLFDGIDAWADIVLGPGGEELYIVGMVDGAARIVQIALDDDDADGSNNEEVAARRGKENKESAIDTASTTNMAKPFFDLSKKCTAKSSPTSDAVFSIVVDNFYATYPGGGRRKSTPAASRLQAWTFPRPKPTGARRTAHIPR